MAAIAGALLLSGCMTGTATSTGAPTNAGTPVRIISSPADAALYMDTLHYELSEALAGSQMTVERNRDDIILRKTGDGLFEPNGMTIKPAFSRSLTVASQLLRSYDRTLICIDGHTDSSGTMTHNMELSLARAEAVAALLKSQGIAAARIAPQGMGPLQPLADNHTAEGRQLNRRVELTIRPLLHLP